MIGQTKVRQYGK